MLCGRACLSCIVLSIVNAILNLEHRGLSRSPQSQIENIYLQCWSINWIFISAKIGFFYFVLFWAFTNLSTWEMFFFYCGRLFRT